MKRAVFLDRDGVINECRVTSGKPYPPRTVDDFVLLPGVIEACGALKGAGFLLVVATNQPDVGRGTIDRAVVEAIHERMRRLLPLDDVEVCFHSGREEPPCDCRKPGAGMLRRAAKALGINLSASWMVGDRWRDIDCGHEAGCRTVFIDCGYDEKLRQQPDFIARSLRDAAGIIVAAGGP